MRISFLEMSWPWWLPCTSKTDIFLFDMSRSQYLDTINYKICEGLKDGRRGMILRSNICKDLEVKKPNVVMVFSTKAPDMSKLSKDRWRIFKISKDLENLVENHTSMDYDSVDGCSDFEY